jgi:hypothetical protein
VKETFGRLYGIHSAILIPLSGKLGPDIAARLGMTDDASVLAVQEMLDREIHGALDQIERTLQAWIRETALTPTLFGSES